MSDASDKVARQRSLNSWLRVDEPFLIVACSWGTLAQWHIERGQRVRSREAHVLWSLVTTGWMLMAMNSAGRYNRAWLFHLARFLVLGEPTVPESIRSINLLTIVIHTPFSPIILRFVDFTALEREMGVEVNIWNNGM